jgi:hypothetical protein
LVNLVATEWTSRCTLKNMVSRDVEVRGYLLQDHLEQAIEAGAAEVVREGWREDEVAGGQPVDVDGRSGGAEVEDHDVDGVPLTHQVDEAPQPVPHYRGIPLVLAV